MRYIILLLFLPFLTFTCRRPELTELDFFVVKNLDVRPQNDRNAGIIALQGFLEKTNGNAVQRCGFVWSDDLVKISTSPEQLPEIQANTPDGDGLFKVLFEGIVPKQTLYFRAFAIRDERRVYAESAIAFRLGDMVTLTEVPPIVDNNSILIEARLIGWEELKVKALRHGHVYAPESITQMPRLGLAGCDTTLMDTLAAADYDFKTRIKDLNFNTKYYVRAYALTETDTFYSKNLLVEILDGWKPVEDIPGNHADGAVAVVQDKAYLGLGATNPRAYNQSSTTNRYFQFDPSAIAAGLSPWSKKTDFGQPIISNPPASLSTSSFSINGEVYVIYGGYEQPKANNTTEWINVLDFWKYKPSTNQWEIMPYPPDTMAARFNAVAFVLGNKAYVGSGASWNSNTAQLNMLNDFWEYNAGTGKWRKVAKLPARLPNGSVLTNYGRSDAAVFVLNGRAFVGGGINVTTGLTDFWEFVPPQNDNDPGSWKEAAPFKGISRKEAISFAVDGTGYYGLGYHLPQNSGESGYFLNDFWAFDPVNGWNKRTPYKGGKRARAFGFGIGSKGYAGAGEVTIVDSIQLKFTDLIKRDFWEYVPRKK